ncbi:MAG: LysE family transporter [Hamadaea sp.]|nr:LysE family transporter [Hamadaea sp.]
MTVRATTAHGRTTGLLCAAGIALVVLVHVAYTLLGLGLVLARSPQAITVLKYAGAAYLIYIGYKTITARPPSLGAPAADVSRAAALRTGFLTNALNPKTMLFVVSTFTQVAGASTPVAARIGYGIFMSATHLVWFGLVALVLSREALRDRLLRRQVLVNRGIGTVLVGLGVTLAVSS